MGHHFPNIPLRILQLDLQGISQEFFPDAAPTRTTIDDYLRALESAGRITEAVEQAAEKAQRVRESTRCVFYIAGPLRDVDDATKARYATVHDLLSSYQKGLFFGYAPHLEGTDPKKNPNLLPTEVRDIDYLWATLMADFHINFWFPTSHGNAVEEGWAEKGLIPSIFLHPSGKELSRFVLGMNNVVELVQYQDFFTDGIGQLQRLLDEMATWLKLFPDRDPREFYYLSARIVGDPIQGRNGPGTSEFHPAFCFADLLCYVRNPEHPRHGQVGTLSCGDWRDSGVFLAEFPDGAVVQFPNNTRDVSYWWTPHAAILLNATIPSSL